MNTIEVWAPRPSQVRLATGADLAERSELTQGEGGWWSATVASLQAGDDYAFLLDEDDTPIPDPRSRWQPAGVHGPSRIYDQSGYEWSDEHWTGRPLPGAVLYELHVGTFTGEGTFDAAIGRLDHLTALGIDVVELLPVAAVNGTHNWGYDGVDWYAVHEPYGGPDGLKRFVDACHRSGIGVVLDVVYNHLGPSGNYLSRFGPYLSSGSNAWGENLNLDGPDSDPVRAHILGNMLMWFADFHVDGLRLDAVHALADNRAVPLLEEASRQVDALSAQLRRPLSLIAESDLNDPRLVTPVEAGGYGLTAQWSDDFHHALHATLTGERQGYYADFGSLDTLARTLRRGFFHADTWSSFRRRTHGRPIDTERTAGWRLLGYLQNHDQVGNRATGDRISASLSPGLVKTGAALVLTSAFTPMLFMGEEWAASTPWQFFTSHPEPDLAAAVASGRREEFVRQGWDSADVPDPQDPATFARSKLKWDERGEDPHEGVLDFYRRLIALRHGRPELTDPRLHRIRVSYDEHARWLVLHRGSVAVVCNLATDRQQIPVQHRPVEMLLASAPGFVYSGDELDIDGESVAIVVVQRR